MEEENITRRLKAAREQLQPYADILDSVTWDRLSQQVVNLDKSLASVRDENRNLRIAIIGQMKSGKSSFLNAALFDVDVLPKAVTPMTAALTKITYSETPFARIEFYPEEEWRQFELKAKQYRTTYEKARREIEQESKGGMFARRRRISDADIRDRIGDDTLQEA